MIKSSTMEIPVNTFLHLSVLLEIIYKPASTFNCAQLTRKGQQPCGNKIKNGLDRAKRSFEQLLALINDTSRLFTDRDGAFDTILTQLIQSCLCQGKHHKNADHARSQWKQELYDRETRVLLRSSLQGYLSESWKESIISTPRSSAKFTLWNPKTLAMSKEDVARKVTEKAHKLIKGSHTESGRLYLFALPEETDMFKLGFTKNAKTRFSTHRRCYGKIEILKTAFLPFARRIEQLVFTELSQKRYKLAEKCSCTHAHNELIQTNEADMVAVFDKWVDFARGENKFARVDDEIYDKTGKFNSKNVVLPSPAGDYQFSVTPLSKKKSRVSNGISPQDSPSKSGRAGTDDSFIDEGISGLSFDDSQSLSDDDEDYDRPVSSLADSLAAAKIK
jgi:hypothetical protein